MIGPTLGNWMVRCAPPPWLEGWSARRVRGSLPALHATAPAADRRRLYLDLSVITRHDAGTGIQRVVRSVSRQLEILASSGWEVIPVVATKKEGYRPAGADPGAPLNGHLDARPGDVFLGLDLALDTVHLHRRQLAAFRRSGGQLWFAMFDLLPATRPDWFSDRLVLRFRRWLRVLAGLADGFYCISAPVESELRERLASHYGIRGGYRTRVLPMGHDIEAARHSAGVPPEFDALLHAIRQRPTTLMVGTVEPRKGHADALAAFDLLWSEGLSCNFVVVGRPGWKTEPLQACLRRHLAARDRLFWLDDASDEAVTRLYDACDGVIAPSHAEGYGLPVIEALGRGKPVLARDLPVFRTHTWQGITFFPTNATPQELAQAIREWLSRARGQQVSPCTELPTWTDTARAIYSALEEPSTCS